MQNSETVALIAFMPTLAVLIQWQEVLPRKERGQMKWVHTLKFKMKSYAQSHLGTNTKLNMESKNNKYATLHEIIFESEQNTRRKSYTKNRCAGRPTKLRGLLCGFP